MNFNSVSKNGFSNSFAPSIGKIDKAAGGKVGQEGVAEAAKTAAPADVPKIANEIAQSLTAAADKFTKLAAVNPFSQKVGMMMDVLAKGHEAIKEALDSWGESIREQAKLDHQADITRGIKKQENRLDGVARNKFE